MLEQDNAALRVHVPTLRQESTSLRHENSLLRQEIASLRTRNATLLNEVAALRAQVPAAVTQPRPPTSVRCMTVIIGDYEPQDADEIGFVVGDAIFVNLLYPDRWGQGFHATTSATGHFPLSHVSPDASDLSVTLASIAPHPATTRLDSLPEFAQQGPTTPSLSRGLRDIMGPPKAVSGWVAGIVKMAQVQSQVQGGNWWPNAGVQTGMVGGRVERGVETVGLQVPASGSAGIASCGR
ncbi:hypothetical protein M427DRAFT_54413 [Gonapodya prolifera JEL478]|uniref:SH3 domain-containing protein n=1 Tax=Gonapodya prolifera (strain JEL478) TaxID=1344416 RepID=A0A139AMN3_GONPJ|nr:hypothetical protein M427DRAFT_54413 [Gonapodya prolifera JEL478]|eukprot:KXS17834.1 hypothetical protein M427DRAFT_54413 [Gonapodya prolifera JEL478]